MLLNRYATGLDGLCKEGSVRFNDNKLEIRMNDKWVSPDYLLTAKDAQDIAHKAINNRLKPIEVILKNISNKAKNGEYSTMVYHKGIPFLFDTLENLGYKVSYINDNQLHISWSLRDSAIAYDDYRHQ